MHLKTIDFGDFNFFLPFPLYSVKKYYLCTSFQKNI